MNFALVEKIADAVLYEGYILYPYRPSAVKNQQRWNFGALCPASYSEAQNGTEAYSMQTQCLLHGSAETSLDVKVRFLHLVTRSVAEAVTECAQEISDCGHRELVIEVPELHFQPVPALEVNGKTWLTWDEAVEREVLISDLKPYDLLAKPYRHSFSFSESESVEKLVDDASRRTLGVAIRRQETIAGMIEVFVTRLDHAPTSAQAVKLTVRVFNQTPFENAKERTRNEALMRSPVSTHTILNVRSGEFYSLLDPPDTLRGAAAGCSNVGTYPVLVGDEGVRDCMLSSPIILYDYPQIAPESAGNLFDGTEIDEILTLRIMTLTDEEKREIRGADDRARQILERTEALPAEQLMKMHGAMKALGRTARGTTDWGLPIADCQSLGDD